VAQGGLERRQEHDASGNDETQYLAPLNELVEQRKTPSNLLREQLQSLPTLDARTVVEATRLF
jgi:gamma-glutamylcysteine synthetase